MATAYKQHTKHCSCRANMIRWHRDWKQAEAQLGEAKKLAVALNADGVALEDKLGEAVRGWHGEYGPHDCQIAPDLWFASACPLLASLGTREEESDGR